MVYKHVIGLKTDSSQSNLGGNTDSNHLISGNLCHFLFAFLLMVIILSCSPRYSAGLSIIYLRFNPATISRPLRTSTSLSVCPFPGIECRLLFCSFRRLMSSGFLGLTSRPADQFLIIISHTRVGVYSLRKQLVIWSSGLPSTFYIAISIYLL